MATSHTVFQNEQLEFSVDANTDTDDGNPEFDLSMGTGFVTGQYKSSVNIELCRLNLTEFRNVVIRMQEILEQYDANAKER